MPRAPHAYNPQSWRPSFYILNSGHTRHRPRNLASDLPRRQTPPPAQAPIAGLESPQRSRREVSALHLAALSGADLAPLLAEPANAELVNEGDPQAWCVL